MAKLANIMIGLVLFSMVIGGLAVYMGGFEEHYDITIEDGWSDVYNISQNITSLSDEMTNILEEKDANWVVSGARLGYSVLKTVFKLPSHVNTLIDHIFARFHICPVNVEEKCWIRAGIKTILVISLIFLIAQALVRWYL